MSTNESDKYWTLLLRCPNHRVCGNLVSEGHMELYNGMCLYCSMYIGEWCGGRKLAWRNIEDCCVCYEENLTGVSIPWCDHFVCVECFKKLFRCLSDEWNEQSENDTDVVDTLALMRCPLCRAGRHARP